MTTPALALTLSYWFHMLATVVWVGGLSTLAILVLPAARRTLESSAYAALLTNIQRRLDLLGWFSLSVLVVSGLVQMSASPHYEGFLSISNTWAAAILTKHVVIGIMIAASAYLTWGVFPRLQRMALLQAKSPGSDVSGNLDRLNKTNARLLAFNLGLAVIILALTAIARVA